MPSVLGIVRDGGREVDLDDNVEKFEFYPEFRMDF